MIPRKSIGLIAMATPLWFFVVYLVMSGLRPEYSYLTNAVSELGSVDAPRRWIWNILGFILPGLSIALLGAGLRVEFHSIGKSAVVPAFAVIISGLFLAWAGVFPADMAHRTGPETIMHLIGALGSYITFLVAGLWLPFVMRRHREWRWLTWLSLALVIVPIGLVFLVPRDTPGLGQRIVFASYFLWVGLAGYALVRSCNAEKRVTTLPAERSSAART